MGDQAIVIDAAMETPPDNPRTDPPRTPPPPTGPRTPPPPTGPKKPDAREQGRRPLASADEVSAYLGVPVTTLRQWRHKRTGPRASKVGRHLRYRWSDVEKWLDQQAT